MSNSPAFQLYAERFVAGSAAMTQGEVGAYILLLCYQWNHGSIPVQPEQQKMIARGDVSDQVCAKFKKGHDGLLRNERLEKEREKQRIYREIQAAKGKKSGEARRAAVEQRLNSGSNPVGTGREPDVNLPYYHTSIATKLTTKGNQASEISSSGKKLARNLWPLAARLENALGQQWVNDAGKWVKRLKEKAQKFERVVAEVESAITEKRIKTTPAQYAEQIWKEFK